MTLTIARDLSREGIRVNTIQPGIFNTPAMAGATPKMLEALGAMVPFPPRLGASEEYASLALEMIRNGYFNGETVRRSEEHTSELQSLMRISYAVFCLKKKK